MIPQRIQRKRTKGWRMPGNTVYVGRGSVWGNPWREGSTGWTIEPGGKINREPHEPLTREQAIESYRNSEEHSIQDIDYGASMQIALAGKNLACWCPLDKPCHADVLLELANGDRLPKGTPILFWPGAKVGEGRVSITRTPIWKMGDGTEVVSVQGYPGGIALTHIEATP